MGAGNVKAAFGIWGRKLPDRPFRLLTFMALTAKDTDDPPTYWGGRESLAVGLGRDVPSGESEEERKARHSTFVAVESAVRQLVKAGALKRVGRPSPGHNARYALNFPLVSLQATPGLNGTGESCPSVQAQPVEQYRPILRTGQAQPVREEEQEPQGLISGLAASGPAQALGRAHARETRCEFIPDQQATDHCDRCGLPANHPRHLAAS